MSTTGTKTVTLSSGTRKYSPVWRKIKEFGECRIKCPVEDVVTIVKAVGKEKGRDKNAPAKKELRHRVKATEKNGEVQVTFVLINKVTLDDL